MTEKDSSSIAEAQHSTNGFVNGLMWGVLLGAAGYYLFATEEGRKLKDELVEKGKDSLIGLKEQMQALPETVETVQKEAKHVKKQAEKKITALQQTAEAELKQLEKSVEDAKKKADAMQQELQKAAAKIEKKFFVRKGKSLKK